MSKQALIHIGTGKTGTTSLQNSLSTQKHKLQGVCYPNITGNAHHFLALIYQEYNQLSRGHRSNVRDARHLQRVAVKLRSDFLESINNADKIIISSEFLSRFQQEEILALKNDLEEIGFTNFLILCYVRDPVSYFKSVLQQKMKASHTPLNPMKFHYTFRECIELYGDLFNNNIIVQAYDKSLYQGCVVQDFLKHAKEFFNTPLFQVKTENTNRSLSAEALFILQKYRELYESDMENIFTNKSRALLDTLSKLPAEKTTTIKLQQEIGQVIIRRHKEDVDWLKTNYKIRFGNHSLDYPADETNAKNIDYKLLRNIVCKPSEDALDRIKFLLLDQLLWTSR